MSGERCAVIAYGASSALGEGERALGVGAPGQPAPVAVARDPELEAAKLQRPFCGRVPGVDVAAGVDRATVLLERALGSCAAQLDAILPGWRTQRVGLALGTSSGGMRAFEEAFAEGGRAEGSAGATYLGPVLAAARPCDVSPFAFVLGACASGTLAIGLARAWLIADACDLVLCGGFDAVSVFVASGFEVLRATCTDGAPRPFRTGRDGLALGEGAAVLALVRARDAATIPALGYVAGFGASCDAVHLTAPDREGRGLARAAAQAIADAGAGPIGLVSAHGTATEYNDAAEARALAAVLGPRLGEVPLHALKGGIGHTLGAAGALETAAALVAMKAGIAPASAGQGPLDGGVRVLERAAAHDASVALKLSAAFGGANAALVLTRDRGGDDSAPLPPRAVHVSRAVAVTGDVTAALDPHALAALTGYAEDRLARADGLVRLTMAAVARLRDALAAAGQGSLAGAGIVVGHGLATIDTNAAYLARINAAGASRGEPRRFPYTTPNAPAGECAVAFGLTGPAFAVGCGPHGGLDALATAADLVRAGVVDRVVVVAVDEAGAGSRRVAPDTQPGAVAVLVAAAPLAARLESWAVGLPRAGSGGEAPLPRAVEAHRALLPLVADRPDTLSLDLGGGGFAKACFFWL
ncbi:MAG TPA: beta-ketoacyl synthase N-terminal-like domain-containing protein [Labilithrix sp.]|nr:beta-ketoacyl synthase N-terminal-like domain-containing protein [Labilithrix sp.]